jgi:(p)ppGpp synthase/HD superfamily hydrolase
MKTDPYDIYQEALAYAIPKHGDQMYGDERYEVHLRRVCAWLDHANWNGSIDHDQFIAGACHDLYEDTGVTREEIVARYGVRVDKIIWACTGVGKNRKEKQASIVQKLIEFPDAVPDKMADRIVNMHNCIKTKNFGLLKMYQKEFTLYDAVFKSYGNHILYEEFVKLSHHQMEEGK